MRRFELHRDEDVSGISGTGVVAEGVVFSNDGPVALRWLTDWPTSVVFHDRGLESLEHVHGHGGRTRIVWIDDPDAPTAAVGLTCSSASSFYDDGSPLLLLCQRPLGHDGPHENPDCGRWSDDPDLLAAAASYVMEVDAGPAKAAIASVLQELAPRTWVDAEDRPLPPCAGCELGDECEDCLGEYGPVITSEALAAEIDAAGGFGKGGTPFEVWIPEMDRWIRPDNPFVFSCGGQLVGRRFRRRELDEVPSEQARR